MISPLSNGSIASLQNFFSNFTAKPQNESMALTSSQAWNSSSLLPSSPPLKWLPSLSKKSNLQENALFRNISHLKISKEDQRQVRALLEELATSSVWHLAKHALRLTQIGAHLKKEVHPYRFLLEIFSNPSSIAHLKTIHEKKDHPLSGRVWKDFVSNLGKNFLSRIEDKGLYAVSFAKELHLSPLLVSSYELEQDWEGLMNYLVLSLANSAP